MSDARRLLVITYHFGAEGAVGGLRWLGYTKYLARLGWTSAVLTGAETGEDERAPAVLVERCPRVWTCVDGVRFVRRLVRGRGRGGFPPADSAPPPSRDNAGILHQLGREVAAWLEYPDYGRGWIIRAALRARALIRRFRPEVVVSSGPPHSAHVVAGLALAGTPVRWLIDLRDPWAGPLPPIWRSHRILGSHTCRALTTRLERLAVRVAAGIVTTTPQLAEVLAAQYPGAPVVCVPSGVDADLLPPAARDPYPGLAVAYAGTLYAGRDIGAVVRGLQLFFQRHPEAAQAGSKLRVAGEAESHHALAFSDAVAATGMRHAVEMLGRVPRAEALQVLSRSRLAVVLAQQQELQIPAKLYEPLAMGVPTLVVAPEGSATAVAGRRLGAIVHDQDDVEGIAGLLSRLWSEGAEQQPRCAAAITYDALAPQLDTLLRNLHSRAPASQGTTLHAKTAV
ncbi:MAG: glycosyltransferase [Gemmatimonadales bacterium]